MTPSRRTCFSATCPIPPFFDPGPAYNNFGWPDPITGAASMWRPSLPAAPVYGPVRLHCFECDIFGFDPQHQNALHGELQPQHPAADSPARPCSRSAMLDRKGTGSCRFFDISQPTQRRSRPQIARSWNLPTCAAPTGAIQDFGVPRRISTAMPVRRVLHLSGELDRQIELQLASGQLAQSTAGTALLRSSTTSIRSRSIIRATAKTSCPMRLSPTTAPIPISNTGLELQHPPSLHLDTLPTSSRRWAETGSA